MVPFPPWHPEARQSGLSLSEWSHGLLSEADVRHLEEGLETFMRVYGRLPPQSFPDVVLCTDTSARPLAALFRPALRSLAERARRPDPEIGFLVTHSNDLIIDALWNGFADWDTLPAWYLERRSRQIDRLIERARRKMLRAPGMSAPDAARMLADSRRFIEGCEEERHALPETVRVWGLYWDRLVTRFCDIAERVRRRAPGARTASVLVIDDQVHEGHTAKLVMLAVHAANERLARRASALPLELRFFTFADAHIGHHLHENDYPGVPHRDFRVELADRYLVGCRSPLAGEFRYTALIDEETAEELDPAWKERSVGVTKSLARPYAQRSRYADPERMRALRRLLDAIGTRTVDALVAGAHTWAP